MKKVDLRVISEKKGLWSSVIMIFIGGAAAVFFGMALIGFAISPDLLRQLPSAVVTAVILAGAVILVRRGRGGLKQYRSSRRWAEEPVRSEAVAVAPPKKAATFTCAGCGATVEDDGSGCCEYCGLPLQIEEE